MYGVRRKRWGRGAGQSCPMHISTVYGVPIHLLLPARSASLSGALAVAHSDAVMAPTRARQCHRRTTGPQWREPFPTLYPCLPLLPPPPLLAPCRLPRLQVCHGTLTRVDILYSVLRSECSRRSINPHRPNKSPHLYRPASTRPVAQNGSLSHLAAHWECGLCRFNDTRSEFKSKALPE